MPNTKKNMTRQPKTELAKQYKVIQQYKLYKFSWAHIRSQKRGRLGFSLTLFKLSFFLLIFLLKANIQSQVSGTTTQNIIVAKAARQQSSARGPSSLVVSINIFFASQLSLAHILPGNEICFQNANQIHIHKFIMLLITNIQYSDRANLSSSNYWEVNHKNKERNTRQPS